MKEEPKRPTIEEQLASHCIHFTGIDKRVCKVGIEYDSFGPVKFKVIPCIKGGSAFCQCQQFPMPEEAKALADEGKAAASKSIKLLFAAKKHFAQTKKTFAKIKCPHGDHDFFYNRAPNGHFSCKCAPCEISLME